jgi:hypothetical protein
MTHPLYETKYVRTSDGHLVLAGLTAAETEEFEMLDATQPQAADGSAFVSIDEAFTSPRERRWLELYTKHQTALQLSNGAEAAARDN